MTIASRTSKPTMAAKLNSQERPTSDWSIDYNTLVISNIRSSTTATDKKNRASKLTTILKLGAMIGMIALGFYYASSEVMLAKYATPRIYDRASRSLTVNDVPASLIPYSQGINFSPELNWKLSHGNNVDDSSSSSSSSVQFGVQQEQQLPQQQIIYENTSYVHYKGCCGIGHRLARMSNAYHAATRLNFALRGTWPSCQKTNVYDHLFEALPSTMVGIRDQPYEQSNLVIKFQNEVPGYTTVSRSIVEADLPTSLLQQNKNNETSLKRYQCNTCHNEKIESDYNFYKDLLRRFRKRDQVEKFQRDHQFANHTVIGMHVRAGNGEKGDFVHKQRDIPNTTHFVETVRTRILKMVESQNWTDPPLLFLATDTPDMLHLFQQAFHSNTVINMVQLPQIRPSPGEGILFGERRRKHTFRNGVATRQLAEQEDDNDNGDNDELEKIQRENCLLGWDQAFMDMMILASSDVVVATRRSSFVQTIPLSMVTGKPRQERKVAAPYCEISQDSLLQMTCHESYMDWCCCSHCVQGEDDFDEQQRQKRGKTKKRKQNYEYVKQMQPEAWNIPPKELYRKTIKISQPGGFYATLSSK